MISTEYFGCCTVLGPGRFVSQTIVEFFTLCGFVVENDSTSDPANGVAAVHEMEFHNPGNGKRGRESFSVIQVELRIVLTTEKDSRPLFPGSRKAI